MLIGNDRYVGVAELAGTLGVMLFALGIKTLRVYENEKWMILSSSLSSSSSVKAVFSAIKISTYVLVMVVLIASRYFNVA